MGFRCISMPTANVQQFRAAQTDSFGRAVRHMTAAADTGYLCRHCLAQAGKGNAVLLGSYEFGCPLGHYWTPSPVFVCAGDCVRFEEDNVVPAALRQLSLVGIRPYDAEDQMLYELNDVTTGDRLMPLLNRCLEDPRTRYANIHTGRPGCFMCCVEPTPRVAG